MSVTNLDDVRKALEAKRNELLSRTFDRDEIRIEKAAEEFERLQQQLNREVAIRNLDRASKLLKDVQAAIARFTDGTFGVCLHCEELIPEKRLKAIPWAAYCVACQERLDREISRDEVEDRNGTDELAA
jgi:DnaK suppressor protein